jgi:fibronectin-binding autotransporter adhesin
MAIDDWNGTGDWNLNPTDWSLGAPSSLTEDAFIESGDSTHSTSGWADILNIISGAQLTLSSGATLTATGNLNDHGALTINTTSGNGAAVTIGVGLNNSGALDVDSLRQVHIISERPLKYVIISAGGSSLRIGGALTNSGAVDIGNNGLKASTTVTASALVNTGSITLQGGTTTPATLDITGAAPSTLTGSLTLKGDSLLEFASGGIKTIGAGASLALYGAEARVSIGAGATDSALTGLSSNAGTFDLEGDSGDGAGETSLTTTAGLTNSGTLDVDILGTDSALTIGGVLANTGSVNIGTLGEGLSATTVTARGLVNTGSVTLGAYSGPGATLDVTGAAPSTATGSTLIAGDGVLEFASGEITAIGAGATFGMYGAGARVSIGAGATAKSALSGLSSNAGSFDLEGFSVRYGWGGVTLSTTGLSNSGDLSVDVLEDPWGDGDGGSILTLGGALANTGAVDIGNPELWAPTTVAAKGLANKGTVTLTGASGETAQMTIAGQATNSGTVSIGAGSTVAVTGAGDAYTQSAGTTTVAGTLAGTVNDDGGLVDFIGALTSGDGTGAIGVGGGGKLEFDAAVDSTHEVDFTTTNATMALGDAGAFSGTVEGFARGDTIDLLGSAVTGLAYSTTTDILTVSGSSGIVASLHFGGSYMTSSFALASDGHGGTNILHT